MEIISQILDYIARTNLFNFIIFMSIIVWVLKKVNVTKKMDDAANTVKTTINDSEAAKTDSEEKLHTIEENLTCLGGKIDEILNQAEEKAKIVGEKIVEDGKKSAEQIKENAVKIIENNRVLLKNDILKRASKAAIEVATERIKEELRKNETLHNKFIDESVNTIEGIEL